MWESEPLWNSGCSAGRPRAPAAGSSPGSPAHRSPAGGPCILAVKWWWARERGAADSASPPGPAAPSYCLSPGCVSIAQTRSGGTGPAWWICSSGLPYSRPAASGAPPRESRTGRTHTRPGISTGDKNRRIESESWTDFLYFTLSIFMCFMFLTTTWQLQKCIIMWHDFHKTNQSEFKKVSNFV